MKKTFISQDLVGFLTWTEAANGDANCVYVTLPSLTKSLLLLKKWRDTQQQYNCLPLFQTAKRHFVMLPGSSIQEISTCLGYGNWLVFSSVWDFHFYSGIIDSHANWMIYKRGPEIIRDLVEHFVVVCGRWLTTVYVNILQVNVFSTRLEKANIFFQSMHKTN